MQTEQSDGLKAGGSLSAWLACASHSDVMKLQLRGQQRWLMTSCQGLTRPHLHCVAYHKSGKLLLDC